MDTMEKIVVLAEELRNILNIESMYLTDTISVLKELKYCDSDYMHGFLRELKELKESIIKSIDELHEACATGYIHSLMETADE